MQAEPEAVVDVREVVKDFRVGLGIRKKRVLHGISFSVPKGEIFGFVGPNGAGKTTTLKLLMGLIRPSSGEARILGHDVEETEYRQHVGFLPENPYFYEFLTAREILHFYARLSGVPGADRSKRVEELLVRVGLEDEADARLRTYSKGMLQRVGIAQALVHDPSVIFLDEPMSGLDPIGRKEIRDLILELHADGKTVFMNTHILSDVEMLCDRVAIIVKGRIRYQGSPRGFMASDEHESDVVLRGVSTELAARLEEAFTVRGRGEQIEVRVPEKEVDDLLRTVLDAGASVISVTSRLASLESIFLSAVEQDE